MNLLLAGKKFHGVGDFSGSRGDGFKPDDFSVAVSGLILFAELVGRDMLPPDWSVAGQLRGHAHEFSFAAELDGVGGVVGDAGAGAELEDDLRPRLQAGQFVGKADALRVEINRTCDTSGIGVKGGKFDIERPGRF